MISFELLGAGVLLALVGLGVIVFARTGSTGTTGEQLPPSSTASVAGESDPDQPEPAVTDHETGSPESVSLTLSVVDGAGEPIPGARVTFDPETTVATTDDGTCRVTDLAAAEDHEFSVTADGFTTATGVLESTGADPALEVRLERAASWQLDQAREYLSDARALVDESEYESAQTALESLRETIDGVDTDDDDDEQLDRLRSLRHGAAAAADRIEAAREAESADKSVIGLIGSAASSKAAAETALENDEPDQALVRLESAVSTYETAATLDETHGLSRADDIATRRADVEAMLAEVEERLNEPAPERDLSDISGVLPKDAEALRAAGFESVTDLRRANLSELQDVGGLDPQVALRIKADVGD